jgi:hypothetical protein
MHRFLKSVQTRLHLSRFLLACFASAVIASGLLLANLLNHQAYAQITARAQLLIDTMYSVQEYTQDQLNPIFSDSSLSEFYPQSVPSYAAQEVFQQLREQPAYDSFFYKAAVLNPTNLRDKANTFETSLVKKIQQQNVTKLSGFETVNGAKLFYIAEPIVITNPSCLKCHSTPEIAPQSMVKHYGSRNGFNWKLNEIVGVRVVYVPAKQIFQSVNQAFMRITTIVVVLMIVAIVTVYWFLKRSPRPAM